MSRTKKILLTVAVLVTIATVYILNPVQPEPAGPYSSALYLPGELGLTSESLTLTDTSRPTMRNGDFVGRDFRELEGKLWYPRERSGGPYPLILYSHGFMSSVSEAEYLVEFLVPKGYVVAAVNFPLSTGTAPGGPTVNDVLSQPEDLSFVLEQLLARSSSPQDALFGLIDADRVAAVGLSLGGLTTQLAAFHRQVHEPRLAAAVSIAGPAAFLTSDFFSSRELPFMMIAGTSDAVVPYQENAAPVPQKAPQALLVTLQDGSHIGFASVSSTLMRWFDHPDQLACPLVLAGLDNGEQPAAAMLVPDATIGVSADALVPCTMTDYPRAMRPAEQQMLTRLALYAFLESVFAHSAERRAQMADYLGQQFPGEHSAVRVEGHAGSNAALTGTGVGDQVTQAMHADGRYISWHEHLIDDAEVLDFVLSGGDGLVMTDVDNDGFEAPPEGHVRIAFGSADPHQWHNVTVAEGLDAAAPEDTAVADMNADGFMDILIAAELSHVLYLQNPGAAARHAEWSRLKLPMTEGRGSYIRVFTADLDGDGVAEVIAANKGAQIPGPADFAVSNPVSVFKVTGDPLNAENWREIELSRYSVPQNSEPVDLDGDGDIDIVAGTRGEERLVWFENPGDGSLEFREHAIGIVGDMDIFVGSYSRGEREADDASASITDPLGRLGWFQNPGDARESWYRHDVSRRKRGIFDKFIAHDVDADGDIDFVGTRGNSYPYDGVFWLEQTRSDLPTARFVRARAHDSVEMPLP